MASSRPKKAFSQIPKRTQVGVSAQNGTLSVQQVPSTAAAPTTHPSASADPKGLKNFIAFDVAHGIYPSGEKVDPNQDISDDMSSNSALRVAQVNLYAHQDAIQFGYTWSPVKASDLTSLKTVGKLMDLVVSHLS